MPDTPAGVRDSKMNVGMALTSDGRLLRRPNRKKMTRQGAVLAQGHGLYEGCNVCMCKACVGCGKRWGHCVEPRYKGH